MTWRDSFLRWFGPGMLGGITFGDWFRLLCDNRFDISPRRLMRAAAITAQSAQNSVTRRLEEWRYSAKVRETEVLPPLFVLGHWRSGTTHLHNLLAVDNRFAFPNNYDALFPHAMLLTEGVQSPFMQRFLSPRRPMDNIEWTMRFPRNFTYRAMKTATNATRITAATMKPIPVPMLSSVGAVEIRCRIDCQCIV